MAKRTAEDACVEYALAAFHVRLSTTTIRQNPCEVVAERCGEYDAALEVRPANSGLLVQPNMEDCLAMHWRIEIVPSGNGEGREVPALDYEDMCEACKVRLSAIEGRKTDRKRLGAAKRSVEAVGKRLNKSEFSNV